MLKVELTGLSVGLCGGKRKMEASETVPRHPAKSTRFIRVLRTERQNPEKEQISGGRVRGHGTFYLMEQKINNWERPFESSLYNWQIVGKFDSFSKLKKKYLCWDMLILRGL